MARGTLYETKELTAETWPDFERLFAKHEGAQGGCWCVYYHRSRAIPDRELAGETQATRNRRDKRELVERGRSHGILVYSGGTPVGSCQYGPRAELPRIDAGRNYRRLDLEPVDRLWRITCFFVDRDHRRQGVASAALHAALDSIARRGGGVVEAYPVSHARALATWFGSVAMFEKAGFVRVTDLGRSGVLVRKTVQKRGR